MDKATPVEWLIDNLPIRYRTAILDICHKEVKQAKEMEQDRVRDLEWQIDELKYQIFELKTHGNTDSN